MRDGRHDLSEQPFMTGVQLGVRQVTLQLIGILFCLVAGTTVSMACTCMHLKGDPAGAFTSASAVFSGKVLEIVEGKPSWPESGLKELAVKFRVEKSWKLIRKGEVRVFTVNAGSMCGFTFTVGETYLVYARGARSKLTTDICTRTMGLIGAKEDLEYLKGKQLLRAKK